MSDREILANLVDLVDDLIYELSRHDDDISLEFLSRRATELYKETKVER